MPRVLIVDDDDQRLELIVPALQRRGWCVLQASSSHAAISLVEHLSLDEPSSGGIDLLVADSNMGGMDCFRLLRALLAARADLPAVVIASSFLDLVTA